MELHLFVLERPPEPLDENVVPPTALAFRAELDAVVVEQAGERRPRELGARLGVGDRWTTVACQRLL